MIAEYNTERSRHSLENKEMVCANPIDYISGNLPRPHYQ